MGCAGRPAGAYLSSQHGAGTTRDTESRETETKMTKLEIKVLVAAVYASRKDRTSHPEGKFDSKQRWYPSEIEDADGDGSSTRSPSAAWPYSYMLRCRTAQCWRVRQRSM